MPQTLFSPINANRQTYITSKPFETIDKLKKGQSNYEIALGVSQFDLIKSALDKSFYESKSSLDKPILPPPPSLPEKHVPSLSQIHEDDGENNNLSDKNNSKARDVEKGIELPADADSDSQINEDPIYATCNFDLKINNEDKQ